MGDRAPRRPAHGTIVAYVALFVALSGSAVALQGRNTVRSDDIVNKQVKTRDLAPKAVNSSRLRPGAVGGKAVADGSLGSADLDKSVPAAVIPSAPGDETSRLRFRQGLINFTGEGDNGSVVTDTPIGALKLGCEGSEVGASMNLVSSLDSDAHIVADYGGVDAAWELVTPGSEFPSDGSLPPGGTDIGGSAHIEFRAFGLPNGTPRGTVDVWIYHEPGGTCYALWESALFD